MLLTHFFARNDDLLLLEAARICRRQSGDLFARRRDVIHIGIKLDLNPPLRSAV
jgi:hypothetical protein